MISLDIVVIGEVVKDSNLDKALKLYKERENCISTITNFSVDDVLNNLDEICNNSYINFYSQHTIVIKGNIHTRDYLRAILAIQKYINPEKKFLNHLCKFTKIDDDPKAEDSIKFFLTDGAFNINPSAEDLIKQYDNIKNSIYGKQIKKSAYILAENNENMLDYAKGGLLMMSRPNIKCMQLDTALDKNRNMFKNKINDENVDLLIVPNINVGNAIWKALTVFGGFKVAGIVLGTDFVCRLNSRGDSVESYLESLSI